MFKLATIFFLSCLAGAGLVYRVSRSKDCRQQDKQRLVDSVKTSYRNFSSYMNQLFHTEQPAEATIRTPEARVEARI